MSERIAAAALVACVLVAGCGGPLGGSGTTGSTTTDASADSERVLAAPPATASSTTGGTGTGEATTSEAASDGTNGATTDNETTEGTTGNAATAGTTRNATTEGTTEASVVTYDEDIGYELRASNAGGTERTVTVRVVAENDSAVAFARSFSLGTNESTTFAFAFPHAGTYEAVVEVGDSTATEQWQIPARNPDDALSVHVSDSGDVYVGFVAI